MMVSRIVRGRLSAITKLVPGRFREFSPENASSALETLQFLSRITILNFDTMRTMALTRRGAGVVEPLERPSPPAGERQVLVRVHACGVCRTDLHVVDDELPRVRVPIVPGHEIVGRVEQTGLEVGDLRPGDRVGVAWLAHVCGCCDYCRSGRENLCPNARFTGYDVDGGYA